MTATTWQGRAVPSVLALEATLLAVDGDHDLILAGLTVSTLLGMGYAAAVDGERRRRAQYDPRGRS